VEADPLLYDYIRVCFIFSTYNCILSSYLYLCVILMGNSCLVYFVLNGLTGVRTTS